MERAGEIYLMMWIWASFLIGKVPNAAILISIFVNFERFSIITSQLNFGFKFSQLILAIEKSMPMLGLNDI